MTDTDDPADGRRKRPPGPFERDLVRRVMSELRHGDRHPRQGDPTALGRSAMNTHWRTHLLERLERGDSLEQIDRELRRIGGLTEEERAALWLLAWSEQQRGAPARTLTLRPDALTEDAGGAATADVLVSTLELARTETSMDVAVLGEIDDGREIVRLLAGDAASFGLTVGAALPVEETFCQRLLEGRLANIVPDASNDEAVRDLQLTRAARIGAYIGVPLTSLDARLYVLCCLAHEERPALCERDVLFLRGLAETIIRELDAAPLG